MPQSPVHDSSTHGIVKTGKSLNAKQRGAFVSCRKGLHNGKLAWDGLLVYVVVGLFKVPEHLATVVFSFRRADCPDRGAS
jgi:hypothetical protein